MPPAVKGGSAEADVGIDVSADTAFLKSWGIDNISGWTESSAPTAQGCADAVSAIPQRRVTAKPGTIVCVTANRNHVAALQVKTIDRSDRNYPGIMVLATVWDTPSP